MVISIIIIEGIKLEKFHLLELIVRRRPLDVGIGSALNAVDAEAGNL